MVVKALVTGAKGFIGKNLVLALRRAEVVVAEYDIESAPEDLLSGVLGADIVFHLAGVNRPKHEGEFRTGNVGSLEALLQCIDKVAADNEETKQPLIVLSSSAQAALDNPYGRSKLATEEILQDYSARTGTPSVIYRLPGVFGKWCKPNYNSVVATFCHNVINGLDVSISDPNRELELVYIDDVVSAFLRHLDGLPDPSRQRYTVPRSYRVTLGDLAERVRGLHAIRGTLTVPDLSDDLMVCLHATYLSYLPNNGFAYPVKLSKDDRGWLFELIKSEQFGQIFVSKTKCGITRGNHYHDTKIEKFCVIHGQGVIRFRQIDADEILEYTVDEQEIKVVDIPPGYTHSIENTGDKEMICLFWANQIFAPDKPDTYFQPVSLDSGS